MVYKQVSKTSFIFILLCLLWLFVYTAKSVFAGCGNTVSTITSYCADNKGDYCRWEGGHMVTQDCTLLLDWCGCSWEDRDTCGWWCEKKEYMDSTDCSCGGGGSTCGWFTPTQGCNQEVALCTNKVDLSKGTNQGCGCYTGGSSNKAKITLLTCNPTIDISQKPTLAFTIDNQFDECAPGGQHADGWFTRVEVNWGDGHSTTITKTTNPALPSDGTRQNISIKKGEVYASPGVKNISVEASTNYDNACLNKSASHDFGVVTTTAITVSGSSPTPTLTPTPSCPLPSAPTFSNYTLNPANSLAVPSACGNPGLCLRDNTPAWNWNNNYIDPYGYCGISATKIYTWSSISGGIWSGNLPGIYTSYTSSPLNQDECYSVTARYLNPAGLSNYFEPQRVKSDTKPPEPPKNVGLNVNSNSTLTLSWDGAADQGCAGMGLAWPNEPFWAQMATDINFNNIAANWTNSWSEDYTDLRETSTWKCAANQTVYARVQARDKLDNQSGWSEVVSRVCPAVSPTISTTPVCAPPDSPNVAIQPPFIQIANRCSQSSVACTKNPQPAWNASLKNEPACSITDTNIYSYPSWLGWQAGRENFYTLTKNENLTHNQCHTVNFRYQNLGGIGGWDYTPDWVQLDTQSPPPPPNLQMRFENDRRVALSWDGVADNGCAGLGTTSSDAPYWLQLSENSAFKTVVSGWTNGWHLNYSDGTETSSWTCTPGERVYAQARSRDKLDNQSAWSETVSGICPKSPMSCSNVSISPLSPQKEPVNVTFNYNVSSNVQSCFADINSVSTPLTAPVANRCSLTRNFATSKTYFYELYMRMGSEIALCQSGRYCVDSLAPNKPTNEIISCQYSQTTGLTNYYKVTYQWGSVLDNGCLNALDQWPYWAQMWDGLTNKGYYNNVWGDDETQAVVSNVPEGVKMTAHVQARDALENESGWSAGVSKIINPANCTGSTPTPTPTPTIATTPTAMPTPPPSIGRVNGTVFIDRDGSGDYNLIAGTAEPGLCSVRTILVDSTGDLASRSNIPGDESYYVDCYSPAGGNTYYKWGADAPYESKLCIASRAMGFVRVKGFGDGSASCPLNAWKSCFNLNDPALWQNGLFIGGEITCGGAGTSGCIPSGTTFQIRPVSVHYSCSDKQTVSGEPIHSLPSGSSPYEASILEPTASKPYPGYYELSYRFLTGEASPKASKIIIQKNDPVNNLTCPADKNFNLVKDSNVRVDIACTTTLPTPAPTTAPTVVPLPPPFQFFSCPI